jgi:arginyl-tRNA--protein-N-Asp/Glu arginylyltransferase
VASLEDLKLYQTNAHSCSYLDEQAITVFIDPDTAVDKALYSQLSRHGFRRSGQHLYRPHCESCRQCILARIPAANFCFNRSQKRCFRGNSDLRVEIDAISDMRTDYPLYARYISERHRDGDMYPPSEDQYRSFLSAEWGVTRFARFYRGQRLVAVSVFDLLDDGLSAVYTYFDPLEEKRGLGNYAILWQIEQTKSLGLDYLYLGYWIKDCQKMSYKINFRPLQLYIDRRWLTLG